MTIDDWAADRSHDSDAQRQDVVWSRESVEADSELWDAIVDRSDLERERFRSSLFGGLADRLSGKAGLDERDDPANKDYMLSSLRRMVEDMGGKLEVAAVFPGVRLQADVSGDGPLWVSDIDHEVLLARIAEVEPF